MEDDGDWSGNGGEDQNGSVEADEGLTKDAETKTG